MAHESAKQLLQRAQTFVERTEAVHAALALGMPLHAIEAYLDWLDSRRPGPPPAAPADDLPPADAGPRDSGPASG